MTTTTVPTIDSIVLEVADVAAAEAFHAALGVADRVHVRFGEAPTRGFRGYTLSLVVSQPSTVDAFIRAALDGGATAVKPPAKSFWGYGGVVQAPDGAIWQVATSSKKDTGPAALEYDDLVLLLGVTNVKTTKQFYVEHGLTVTKSFGSRYVEFASPGQGIDLALYSRRAAAKAAGVDPDGSGSHRIVVRSDAGAFTDPDGFAWESSTAERHG
ncbi:glyoxalase [Pseudonocardia humida]|uniref:Glyoxalase n=1 Tax=Pseudonocardia humida TaxID=2800819 RepID=A0ABT1A017_9PSEU|nr:glyoxalase [Pseudonocardia humida]MCO1656316.1 glyoxalase [Pseudonocardia humida]